MERGERSGEGMRRGEQVMGDRDEKRRDEKSREQKKENRREE